MRKIATDTVALSLQYATASLVPLLMLPHISRVIGLGNYGTLAVALAWATFGMTIVQYCFHISAPAQMASVKNLESEIDLLNSILSTKLLLFVLVSVAASIYFLGGMAFSHEPSIGQVIIIFGLPVGYVLNTGWHLQSVGLVKAIAAVAIMSSLVAIFWGMTFVNTGADHPVLMSAIALVIAPTLLGIFTFFLSLWRLRSLISQLRLQDPLKELKNNRHLFASHLFAALYSSSGPIVIGLFADNSQAGAYSLVEKISSAIIGALLLLHVAAYPRLCRVYINDKERYINGIKNILTIYLLSAMLLVLAACFHLDEINAYLFKTRESNYSLLVMFTLVWIFLGIFGPLLTGYYIVSEKKHMVMRLTLKVLLASIALGLPGVMIWGGWFWLFALCASQSIVIAYSIREWNVLTSSNHTKELNG